MHNYSKYRIQSIRYLSNTQHPLQLSIVLLLYLLWPLHALIYLRYRSTARHRVSHSWTGQVKDSLMNYLLPCWLPLSYSFLCRHHSSLHSESDFILLVTLPYFLHVVNVTVLQQFLLGIYECSQDVVLDWLLHELCLYLELHKQFTLQIFPFVFIAFCLFLRLLP